VQRKRLHATGDKLVCRNSQPHKRAGVDVAVEAVGNDATVRSAVPFPFGRRTVTLVGNITPEVTLPLQKAVTRQVASRALAPPPEKYPLAIELLTSGAIKVKPLIFAVAPLEEGPQWFERLYSHERT